MRPVRAVLFDVGDTLVYDDPPLTERAWTACQTAGLPLTQAQWPTAYRAAEAYSLTAYLTGHDWDTPPVLRETINCALRATGQGDVTDTQLDDWGASLSGTAFQRRAHPEAKPLLEELRRRGFLLGAVSDWETTLPEVLAELELLPHFDAVSASQSVGARKPDPRLFHDCLRQLGVMPEDACHVGDWLELDVNGARAAGMEAVLFDHAGRAPHADCPRVETFAQLREFLLSLPCPCR